MYCIMSIIPFDVKEKQGKKHSKEFPQKEFNEDVKQRMKTLL